MTVAAVGYGLAALLFTVLALLLLTQWRGRPKGGYLLAATLVSALCFMGAPMALIGTPFGSSASGE